MSNYMSIQDGDVKREIARAMGEALFKRNGYEILQGCFDWSELHSFIVARDPEDGALVLAECHLVDEFESEGADEPLRVRARGLRLAVRQPRHGRLGPQVRRDSGAPDRRQREGPHEACHQRAWEGRVTRL